MARPGQRHSRTTKFFAEARKLAACTNCMDTGLLFTPSLEVRAPAPFKREHCGKTHPCACVGTAPERAASQAAMEARRLQRA